MFSLKKKIGNTISMVPIRLKTYTTLPQGVIFTTKICHNFDAKWIDTISDYMKSFKKAPLSNQKATGLYWSCEVPVTESYGYLIVILQISNCIIAIVKIEIFFSVILLCKLQIMN